MKQTLFYKYPAQGAIDNNNRVNIAGSLADLFCFRTGLPGLFEFAIHQAGFPEESGSYSAYTTRDKINIRQIFYSLPGKGCSQVYITIHERSIGSAGSNCALHDLDLCIRLEG